MEKKKILLVAFLLTLSVFFSGCVEQNPVRSQEDVSNVVTNISTNVGDVGSTLEEIDRSLGGP